MRKSAKPVVSKAALAQGEQIAESLARRLTPPVTCRPDPYGGDGAYDIRDSHQGPDVHLVSPYDLARILTALLADPDRVAEAVKRGLAEQP